MDIGITKEELLEVAAKRLVDELGDTQELSDKAEHTFQKLIKEVIEGSVIARVNEILTAELEKTMTATFTPVDLFGNATGKPTTIRQVLVDQAKTFWETKVDAEGKHSGGWGGTPRAELLMKKLLASEFENAIKKNAEVVVAEFKKAITDESVRMVKEHINKLIK